MKSPQREEYNRVVKGLVPLVELTWSNCCNDSPKNGTLIRYLISKVRKQALADAGDRPASGSRQRHHCADHQLFATAPKIHARLSKLHSSLRELGMWNSIPLSCLFRPCTRSTVPFARRTVSYIKRPVAASAQYYRTDCRQQAQASTGTDLAKFSKEHRVFPVPRRRFSTSSVSMHGHLTPPKPGEE